MYLRRVELLMSLEEQYRHFTNLRLKDFLQYLFVCLFFLSFTFCTHERRTISSLLIAGDENV